MESAKGACQPEARSIEDFSDRGIVNEDRDFPYCFLLTNSNSLTLILSTLLISADMFESVNKKTVVHPLFKVGLSISKRLPEEARLNSDG